MFVLQIKLMNLLIRSFLLSSRENFLIDICKLLQHSYVAYLAEFDMSFSTQKR